MKDCYFFGSDGGIIHVDTKANAHKASPQCITIRYPLITFNGKGELVSVRDAKTGRYYYPAADCKKIQY